MAVKPIVIAPFYRDAWLYAERELGLHRSQITPVIDMYGLRGRIVGTPPETEVHFLTTRWSPDQFRRERRAEMEQYLISRQATIIWGSI